MMLLEIYHNEDGQILLNGQQHYLQVCWFRRPLSESFRHIQEVALKYALENKITAWLYDLRQLVYLEIADQNWLLRENFAGFNIAEPQTFALVVGTKGMEIDTSYHIASQIEKDERLNKIIRVEIFFDKVAARLWLLDQVNNIAASDNM